MSLSKEQETFFRYCCRDSATTFEINEKLERLLSADQKAHYHRNMDLLNPLLYMELRGISYDNKKAKERKKEVDHLVYELQADLDALAGFGLNQFELSSYDDKETRQKLMAFVRDTLCYKRDPTRPKKGNEEEVDFCIRVLLGEGKLTKAQIGHIEMALSIHLNVDSPKQVKDFLYKRLGLPEQTKKAKHRDEEAKLTSDFEALLKLKRKVTKDSFEDKALTLLIDIGQLLTRSSLLKIRSDPDHRVRTGYNLVGTETGRIASYTSPTGSGYNLQTITAGIPLKPEGHPLRLGMRDLFLADEGHYLFQCDLSGADGWTVGAYMAMLGDPTMLDDLKAKLKPAAIICYILRHGADSVHGKTRAELKEMLLEVKKEDWDYFACKQGIWGTCYLMGPDKLATTIAKRSQGTLWLSRSEVGDFQAAVFHRYHVRTWHNWMASFLKRNNMTLIAPNGFKRKFFAREEDALGQALAHMPQVITTYATNTAMFKLWTDKENRLVENPAGGQTSDNREPPSEGLLVAGRSNGVHCRLRIEPLHQVHDALIGEFKIDDTAWAVNQIKSYFDNPITVANQQITIPFDGAYGTSWGSLDKGTI